MIWIKIRNQRQHNTLPLYYAHTHTHKCARYLFPLMSSDDFNILLYLMKHLKMNLKWIISFYRQSNQSSTHGTCLSISSYTTSHLTTIQDISTYTTRTHTQFLLLFFSKQFFGRSFYGICNASLMLNVKETLCLPPLNSHESLDNGFFGNFQLFSSTLNFFLRSFTFSINIYLTKTNLFLYEKIYILYEFYLCLFTISLFLSLLTSFLSF